MLRRMGQTAGQHFSTPGNINLNLLFVTIIIVLQMGHLHFEQEVHFVAVATPLM